MRFSISGGNADQALDRPGRRVAERADRVAFDLLGHVEQHVDLALLGAALGHALHHAPHPAGALAARRALAAALVLVEIGQPRDRLDDVGRLVHHDHRRRAEARASACAASRNPSGNRRSAAGTQRHRRAAGDDRQQIVPAAAHAAAMRSRSASRKGCPSPLRRCRACSRGRRCRTAWCRCCSAAEARRTSRAAAQDGRRDGDRLDVVHRGRAAVEAHIGRERRLQARHALLALEAFQQRGFLAADIGAGAVVDVEVERPSRGCCPCRSARVIGLVDRRLQRSRSRMNSPRT
jgi:hypothetical protein